MLLASRIRPVLASFAAMSKHYWFCPLLPHTSVDICQPGLHPDLRESMESSAANVEVWLSHSGWRSVRSVSRNECILHFAHTYVRLSCSRPRKSTGAAPQLIGGSGDISGQPQTPSRTKTDSLRVASAGQQRPGLILRTPQQLVCMRSCALQVLSG
eukprot:scaffold1786_cov398-Prasinococcus_capsulatus_cf.AAC.35